MKKKKQLLILVLILAVTTGLAGYGFAEHSAAPIEHQRITSSELPAITQEDVDNNYQDYASDEAKEIARLQRELRDTKDALEVLKKAIGILGK